MESRYAKLEVRTQCTRCGHPLPLGGIMPSAKCAACGNDVMLSPPVWKAIVEDVEEDWTDVPPGGSQQSQILTGGLQIFRSWSKEPLKCNHCQGWLPAERIAPGTDTTVPCNQCGAPIATYPAPPWLKAAIPTATQVFSAAPPQPPGPFWMRFDGEAKVAKPDDDDDDDDDDDEHEGAGHFVLPNGQQVLVVPPGGGGRSRSSSSGSGVGGIVIALIVGALFVGGGFAGIHFLGRYMDAPPTTVSGTLQLIDARIGGRVVAPDGCHIVHEGALTGVELVRSDTPNTVVRIFQQNPTLYRVDVVEGGMVLATVAGCTMGQITVAPDSATGSMTVQCQTPMGQALSGAVTFEGCPRQ